jgi:hypothetical protein
MPPKRNALITPALYAFFTLTKQTIHSALMHGNYHL